MDQFEIRRRINAARELTAPTPEEVAARTDKYNDAGYGITVEELAARIPGHAKLGARTLGKIRRGERDAMPQDLRFIAEACGLPEAFFSVEFSSGLADLGPTDMEKRLTRIERGFSQLAALGLAGLEGDEDQLARPAPTVKKSGASKRAAPKRRAR